MAAIIIGYVAELSGSAQVKTADGIIKVLQIGDAIHEGELLLTNDITQIAIDFVSGKKLEVGGNASILLDASVYRGELFSELDVLADVDALQQELLDAQELADLEETASGVDDSQEQIEEELTDAELIERVGREGDVDTRDTTFDLAQIDDELADAELIERVGREGDVDTRDTTFNLAQVDDELADAELIERVGREGDVDTRDTTFDLAQIDADLADAELIERVGREGDVDTRDTTFNLAQVDDELADAELIERVGREGDVDTRDTTFNLAQIDDELADAELIERVGREGDVDTRDTTFAQEQTDVLADVTTLQQALLDGLNLDDLEATAAGFDNTQIQPNEDLGDVLVVSRDGREGTVDTRTTSYTQEQTDSSLNDAQLIERDGLEGAVETRSTPYDIGTVASVSNTFIGIPNAVITASPATTVRLSATASISEDDSSITYTASVDSATDTAMTVTLSNGLDITIAAGATSGSATYVVSANADVFSEADSTTSATINSTAGGNFESVSIDATAASTTITDSIDDTT
ncbi:MAG: hypothetical protein GQ470_00105, partial [Gammaproteobacteria bacterium]|nr:hypothetical protein [Gammaproteobacteria bacterium]